MRRAAGQGKPTPTAGRRNDAILGFRFQPAKAFRRKLDAGGPSREIGMPSIVRRFLADQTGATAIEYSLIAALIALAILAVLNTTGEALVASLTTLLNAFP
jgi:pilus assembly protein Flp/PilA